MRAFKPFIVLAFVALVGGACSSGGSDDSSAPEEQSRTSPAAEAPDDLTRGTVDLDAGAAQPDDPAAAAAEITENYETFFDSETPQEEALALAEDIDEIRDTLQAAEEANTTTGHRTIEVTDVKFTDVDGVWKVARSTNCRLAGFAGATCPFEE